MPMGFFSMRSSTSWLSTNSMRVQSMASRSYSACTRARGERLTHSDEAMAGLRGGVVQTCCVPVVKGGVLAAENTTRKRLLRIIATPSTDDDYTYYTNIITWPHLLAMYWVLANLRAESHAHSLQQLAFAVVQQLCKNLLDCKFCQAVNSRAQSKMQQTPIGPKVSIDSRYASRIRAPDQRLASRKLLAR